MIRYKLVIGVLVVLCLQSLRAFAQGSEPPVPPVPAGGDVVLDMLNWLTPSQENQINAINKKLDEEGIAQLAVVTLDNCGDDKQKFRNDLFRSWGIGHADDNDGLLILVCWYGGDTSRRSVEQETGYGLEGILPDVLTGRVVDQEFIPAFQSNRPGDGLVAMVRKYDSILRQNITGVKTESSLTTDMKLAFLIIGVLGVIPGLILAITYSSFLSIRDGLTNNINTNVNVPVVFEEETDRTPILWLYRFTLAEILSLFPILGLLYISQKNIIQMSATVLGYSRFIFPFLTAWLIILVLVYASKFFRSTNRTDNWNSGNDQWNSQNDRPTSSGPDLLDTLSDIAEDLPSFGGGDSGGGGSSKKF
ncbi:MAG TPA: TPM domain-containing protein [Anaerolineales bacterium]|nr:TPM domain-containing protein [Anaerolineales bacterium]